jgi:aspartyl-tRNA(Asn)/glutamyl-tRNA(Gln) amidotransferase subunit C
MIDKEQVKHIAKLARLHLKEKEISFFQVELSKILDHIAKIQKLDLKDVKPTLFPTTLCNIFRKDLPKKEEFEKNLLPFLEEKERFLEIPPIFDED